MFKITRVKREVTFEMQNEHYHSYYEFYYLVSGERKFFIDGKNYKIRSGDIVLIPKREIHRTTFFGKGSEHERIAVYFDDEFIRQLKEAIGAETFEQCFSERILSIPAEKRTYIEGLFDRLLAEYQKKDELSERMCKMYCEELILLMIRCQRENKEQPYQTIANESDKDTPMEGKEEMEEAAQYINRHFGEPLTLSFMASRSCMSASYFSRRFKTVTGFGFKEYLNMVRIRHACELLSSTALSITQISEACGYMDSNYFGDAFRKVKKMSPREYRKSSM